VRWLAPCLIACGLSVATTEAVAANFIHYDEDRMIYAYAHTVRGFQELVNDIEWAARLSGTEYETSIAVASPEHWPLPWYLRHYSKAGYYSKIEVPHDAAIVVAAVSQQAEIEPYLGPTFVLIGQFPLRPGVDLLLYTRADLARALREVPRP
jgi:predicted membrane-bound mannosyltransferase